jgi:hypothetical protein
MTDRSKERVSAKRFSFYLVGQNAIKIFPCENFSIVFWGKGWSTHPNSQTPFGESGIFRYFRCISLDFCSNEAHFLSQYFWQFFWIAAQRPAWVGHPWSKIQFWPIAENPSPKPSHQTCQSSQKSWKIYQLSITIIFSEDDSNSYKQGRREGAEGVNFTGRQREPSKAKFTLLEVILSQKLLKFWSKNSGKVLNFGPLERYRNGRWSIRPTRTLT